MELYPLTNFHFYCYVIPKLIDILLIHRQGYPFFFLEPAQYLIASFDPLMY